MKKMWLALDDRSRLAVYMLQAVIALRLMSFFTTFSIFSEVKQPNELSEGPNIVMISLVLFLFVFSFLILRVIQGSRLAKFFALLLTLISFLNTYRVFQYHLEASASVRYLIPLLQSFLLLWATILLFLKNSRQYAPDN